MFDLHSRRPLLVAFVVFLLAAVAAATLIRYSDKHDRELERARVSSLAGEHVGNLERRIERDLSATYALASLVRQGNGAVPNFDQVAGSMLPYYPGVSELALAPGGIIRDVVPLAGNEKAVGHNLLQDPAQYKEASLARDTGKLTLAGPLNLVQGGVGAVGRLPVFLDDAKGTPKFWGFTLVVIRFPAALEAVKLPQLAEQGLTYELWRIPADSGKKQIIGASSSAAPTEPVERTLQVPNATWTLSVAPLGGWGDRTKLALQSALGLLFSLLLGYAAKLLLDLRAHKQGLEALVGERTAEVRAREADLNRAQSIARVGSWVLDVATKELHGTAEALRILGVNSSGPIKYQAFLRLLHPDDRDAVDRAARASLKGAPYDIEYRVLSGATARWVHSNAELRFDADGRLTNALGTIQEITERKRAEQALREGEIRYRELFETNPQPMWVYDLQTLGFLAVNDAAVAHYGYSRGEFLAMLVTDIRPPEELTRLLQQVARVQKQDVRDAGLWRHWRKDGTLIDVEITAHTLEFGGRRAQMVLANDVTERLQAERRLRESEARFRSLTEMSSDFYWESDSEHRLTQLSAGGMEEAAQVLPGGSPLGKRRWQIPYLAPDEAGWEAHRAVLDAHLPFRDFEFSRQGTDGVERHIAISGDPVFDATRAFRGYRGVGKGITERKQREEELRRFRGAMDATADAIYLVDRASLRFVDINAGACNMLGLTREQILEMGPEGVLSMSREELVRIYDSVIAGGGAVQPIEMLRTRKGGAKAWIEVRRHAKQSEAGWTIITVARDITERKRAEEALADSEARFRSLTEMSSDFYWESDAEHRLTARDSANKRLSTVSAFQQGAQLGERRWDIPYLSPDAAGWQAHRAVLDAHLSFRNFELARLGVDGTKRYISISGDPVFDAAGVFKGYRGVGADTTERKQAEAHLRLAASVFDHAQEAITITDADANIIAVNRRFTEITGYSAGEAIGRNPRILNSGRQDRDFYRAMWASIQSEGHWTGEIWNRRKDGRVFPEWLSISAVRDEGGQVINYVAVFVDISQRVAVEQALRASEEKFAKAFRSSPMFICISTLSEGRYIEVNDAFERALGHTRGEIIGRTADEIGLWKAPQDRRRAVDSLFTSGRVNGFEAELCKKSGESIVCEIWAEAIAIEGRPCVIWITNDVTVRKKAETEFRQLNAELEQRVAERTRALQVANNELEAFSYSVSHDLRAPLRAISGFSQLVETEYARKLDEQGRDYLRRVSAGAEKMGQLIHDLLDLSRISRAQMQVEAVDLSELAREVAAELHAEVPERKVEWVIAQHVRAEGDPGLLRVLLHNLLGNAWKYSSRRELARIEFGVAEKEGRAAYFVRDNGAGFDMADADKLFGAFQRLHSAAEFPGTGIGLATVARVIHRHGGEVWGEGRVDEGSVFHFSLGCDR